MPCGVYCRTVLHNIKVDIISNCKYHRTRSVFLLYDRIGVMPTSRTGWVWWTDWCMFASIGVFHKSLTSRISKISFKPPLKLCYIAVWSIYVFNIRRTAGTVRTSPYTLECLLGGNTCGATSIDVINIHDSMFPIRQSRV